MQIREAVFAGSWYPGSAPECRKQILAFENEIDTKALAAENWHGGVVPHAGWYYSGSIACNVIACLANGPAPDVVVILGMHLHPGSSNFIMLDGAWATPLGELPIDTPLAGALNERFQFRVETAQKFNPDNTIELQLPFIKHYFADARIVPIGASPRSEALDIGRTLAELAADMKLNIKVIGSTDLTHYGTNYGFMPQGTGPQAAQWVQSENDPKVIDAMLALDAERVLTEARTNQNACCSGAVATALAAGKALGAERAAKVAYATSYDKSPGDSLVGYVGIVFGA